MKHYLLLLSLLTAGGLPVSVASELSGFVLQQRNIGESLSDVKQRVDRIVESLAALGASDDEMQAYRAAAEMLGTISSTDMKDIIDVLENAALATGSGKAGEIEAYGKQRSVVVQLQALMLRARKQQEMATLGNLLRKISSEQNEALKNTRAAGEQDAGKNTEIATKDQKAIQDEIALTVPALQALSQPGEQPSEAVRQALEKLKAATESSQKGLDSLTASNKVEAMKHQAEVRDTLRQAANTLQGLSLSNLLQQAKTELAQTIAQQKNLAATTAKSDPSNEKENKALKDRQADVADQTATAGMDLAKLAPEIAQVTAQAQESMQKSSQQLDLGKTTEAAEAQKQAAAQLEQAAAKLDEKLAQTRADEAKMAAAGSATEQALLERLQDVARQQALLNLTPDNEKENQLATVCLSLRDATALVSPPAATKVADAASSMKDYQGPAASQHLATAIEILSTKIAQDRNAEQQKAASQQLASDLNAIDKKLDEASEAAKKKDASASDQLYQAGKALDDAAKQNAANLDSEQQKSLAGAQAQIQSAILQAAQKNSAAAQEQIASAQAFIQQAATQAGLAAKGLPNPNDPKNAQSQDTQNKSDSPSSTANSKGLEGKGEGSNNPGSEPGLAALQEIQMGLLAPKDRQAILQSTAEKVSDEYSAQSAQYFKNLAGAAPATSK